MEQIDVKLCSRTMVTVLCVLLAVDQLGLFVLTAVESYPSACCILCVAGSGRRGRSCLALCLAQQSSPMSSVISCTSSRLSCLLCSLPY